MFECNLCETKRQSVTHRLGSADKDHTSPHPPIYLSPTHRVERPADSGVTVQHFVKMLKHLAPQCVTKDVLELLARQFHERPASVCADSSGTHGG